MQPREQNSSTIEEEVIMMCQNLNRGLFTHVATKLKVGDLVRIPQFGWRKQAHGDAADGPVQRRAASLHVLQVFRCRIIAHDAPQEHEHHLPATAAQKKASR